MTNHHYNNRPLSAYLYRGRNGKFNYLSILVTLLFTITIPGVGFVLGVLAAAGLEMVVGGNLVSSVPPAATTVDTTATDVQDDHASAKLPRPRPNVTRNDR